MLHTAKYVQASKSPPRLISLFDRICWACLHCCPDRANFLQQLDFVITTDRNFGFVFSFLAALLATILWILQLIFLQFTVDGVL